MKIYKLSDLKIQSISLVGKPATRKKMILKAEEESPPVMFVETMIKHDAEKGIVYGIVYAPGQIDSHGDMAEAPEIEKACYSFMKGQHLQSIDKHHDGEKIPAFICESWIVKTGDPVFPDEPTGAWAVGVKLESDELITAVKTGELTGLSMAGHARRTEIKKADSELGDMINALHKSLQASVEKKETFVGVLDRFYASALKFIGAEPAVKKSETEKTEEFEQRISELEAFLKVSKQDASPAAVVDTELALGAAIASALRG